MAVVLLTSLDAIATDYFYFADASYFLIALASGDLLDGVWRNFPTRTGALLLTQGPAWLVSKSGAGLGVVKLIYAATFMLAPLMAAWWACLLNPSAGFRAISAIVVGVLTFGTLGFPTETTPAVWLMLLVMAAATADARTGFTRFMGRLTLLLGPPLMLLSHTSALLALPALSWLCWRQANAHGDLVRWRLFLTGASLGLAAWTALALSKPDIHPQVLQSLAEHSRRIVNPRFALTRPLPVLVLFSTLACLGLAISQRMRRPAILMTCAAIGMATWALTWWHNIPVDRYTTRAVVVWLMPALPLMPWVLKQADGLTLRAVCVVAVGLSALHISLIHQWDTHRSVLLQPLTGTPSPVSPEETASLRQLFKWDWTQPFLSVVITNGERRAGISIDSGIWFSALECTKFTHQSPYRRFFSDDEMAALHRLAQVRLGCVAPQR